MSWTVAYNPDINIVEVVYAGLVTSAELEEASAKRIRLQKEFNTTLVLADGSHMEHLAAGIIDVHNLPAELFKSHHANRNTRMALVLPKPKEASATVKYFETASINRGWQVRSFSNRQDALDWLLKTRSSNTPTN